MTEHTPAEESTAPPNSHEVLAENLGSTVQQLQSTCEIATRGALPSDIAVQVALRFNLSEEAVADRVNRWADDLRPILSGQTECSLQLSHDIAAAILLRLVKQLGAATGWHLASSVDVRRLLERSAAAAHLFGTPPSSRPLLYTREHLAARLSHLRGFLEAHRCLILSDGLSPSPFLSSARMDTWLAKLYPICLFRRRWVRSVNPRPATASCYEWLRRESLQNGFGHLISVDRQRADIIDGLTLQEAAQVEALRPHLFSVKIEILRHAEEALLRAPDGRSWSAALDCIRTALQPDILRFLRRIDSICMRWHNSDSACVLDHVVAVQLGRPLPFESGGLTNWLELLWHVECECRHGLMHHVAHDLAALGLLHRDRPGRLSTRLVEAAQGVTVLEGRIRHGVDAALEGFLQREQAVGPLWQEFNNAVCELGYNDELANSSVVPPGLQPPLLLSEMRVRALFNSWISECGIATLPRAALGGRPGRNDEPTDDEIEEARRICRKDPHAKLKTFKLNLHISSGKAQKLTEIMRKEGFLKTRPRKRRRSADPAKPSSPRD